MVDCRGWLPVAVWLSVTLFDHLIDGEAGSRLLAGSSSSASAGVCISVGTTPSFCLLPRDRSCTCRPRSTCGRSASSRPARGSLPPAACPASLAAPGRTCPHTAPAHPSASRSRGGFPHPAGDRGRRSRPRRWSAGSAPQAAQGGVLPAPLGPRNPNTAPGSTARSSPQTPTWPCGQILVSARARITDMAGPTGLRHRPVPSSCQRDLTAVAERPATSGRRAQPDSPTFMRR